MSMAAKGGSRRRILSQQTVTRAKAASSRSASNIESLSRKRPPKIARSAVPTQKGLLP